MKYRLATRMVLDENSDEDELILMRQYGSDRDFFDVGVINEEILEILKDAAPGRFI